MQVGFSTTVVTYQNPANPAPVYIFTDVDAVKGGMGAKSTGAGVTCGGMFGVEGSYTSDMDSADIGVTVQVTPNVHGSVSFGTKGVECSVGVNIDQTSYDVNVHIGPVAFFLLGIGVFLTTGIPAFLF